MSTSAFLCLSPQFLPPRHKQTELEKGPQKKKKRRAHKAEGAGSRSSSEGIQESSGMLSSDLALNMLASDPFFRLCLLSSGWAFIS